MGFSCFPDFGENAPFFVPPLTEGARTPRPREPIQLEHADEASALLLFSYLESALFFSAWNPFALARAGLWQDHHSAVQSSAKNLVEQLSRSKIYQDYKKAFGDTTGLPLSLRAVESWQVPQQGEKHQNPFCALMAQQSRSCAACLEVQEKLSDTAKNDAGTMTCFAGLSDTAVPIRSGDTVVGLLQTGQILLKKPTQTEFARTARQLLDWGLKVDLRKLEDAYFHTRVLAPKQYASMVRLLTIFGQHLSLVSNELLVRQENSEPPAITRAKQFIREHQADKLSLGGVAQAVNTSSFYFCKMFKKATGLNFTEYVSRVRVEKAKNLLLNPNLRVSEIAFEVGFQSLTHFNRVFRKIAGQSPTDYRSRLPAA